MIVGNRYVQGLNAEQAFFHRALRVLVQTRRLTPQAVLMADSIESDEALVQQGVAVFTLRRVGQSVEMFDDAFKRVGRWLV